jgi:hypothetical protein
MRKRLRPKQLRWSQSSVAGSPVSRHRAHDRFFVGCPGSRKRAIGGSTVLVAAEPAPALSSQTYPDCQERNKFSLHVD